MSQSGDLTVALEQLVDIPYCETLELSYKAAGTRPTDLSTSLTQQSCTSSSTPETRNGSDQSLPPPSLEVLNNRLMAHRDDLLVALEELRGFCPTVPCKIDCARDLVGTLFETLSIKDRLYSLTAKDQRCEAVNTTKYVERCEAEIDTLRERVKTLDAENQELRDQIAAMEVKHWALKTRIESAEQRAIAANSLGRKLSEQLVAMRAFHASLKLESSKLLEKGLQDCSATFSTFQQALFDIFKLYSAAITHDSPRRLSLVPPAIASSSSRDFSPSRSTLCIPRVPPRVLTELAALEWLAPLFSKDVSPPRRGTKVLDTTMAIPSASTTEKVNRSPGKTRSLSSGRAPSIGNAHTTSPRAGIPTGNNHLHDSLRINVPFLQESGGGSVVGKSGVDPKNRSPLKGESGQPQFPGTIPMPSPPTLAKVGNFSPRTGGGGVTANPGGSPLTKSLSRKFSNNALPLPQLSTEGFRIKGIGIATENDLK